MRYTKSALGLLNAQYRSVLKKCLLINLGLFALAAISATPAMADDPWTPTTFTVKPDDGVVNFAIGTTNSVDVYDTDTVDNALLGKVNTGDLGFTIGSGAGEYNSVAAYVTNATSGKQAQLTNGTNDISATVATTVRASATADNTTLVTEAGIRSAIDSAVSGMVTESSSATFTNKIFDANATGNSITNLETADFASGVIVTTVGDTGSDTSIATEKAVRTAITNATSGMVTASSTTTLTNKTIDGDDNTIQDLGTGVFKSGVIQTSVRDTSAATDASLATEKAVATALATKVGTSDIATSISSTSDDSHVASAKAVYDYAQAKLTSTSGNAGDGIDITDAGAISVDIKSSDGLKFDSGELTIDSSVYTVKTAGNGLTNTSGAVTVKAGNGVNVTSDGVAVKAKTNGGITVDASGVSVDVDGSTLALDTTSGKVKIADGGVTSTQLANAVKNNLLDAATTSKGLTITDGNSTTAAKIALNLNAAGGLEEDNTNGLQIKLDGTSLATSANGLKVSAIDADTVTVSNLETDNFKSGVVATSIASTSTNTQLATAKAVYDGVTDGSLALKGSTLESAGNTTVGGVLKVGGASGTTFTNDTSSLTVSKQLVDAAGFKVDDNNTLTTAGLAASAATVAGQTKTGSLAIGETGKGFDTTGNLTAGNITATGLTTSADGVALGVAGKDTAITGANATMTGTTSAAVKVGSNGVTVNGTSSEMAFGSNKVTVNSTGTTVTGKTILDASNGLQFGTTEGTPNVKAIDATAAGVSAKSATTLATVTTVLSSAQNADFTVGSTKNIGSTNNTIGKAITALDTAIGDMTGFGSQNYAKTTTNVAGNLTQLDGVLKNTNDIIGAAITSAGAKNTDALTLKTQGGTAVTDLTSAVNLIGDLQSTGIAQATVAGQIGTVGSSVAARSGTGMAMTKTGTVGANLKALDTAIGADMTATGSSRTTTAFQTGAGKTVNANLSALDATIGADMTSVQNRTKGAVAKGNTINTNLQQLDAAIGSDSELLANKATGGTADNINGVTKDKTINQNLTALNNTIGDMTGLNASTGAGGDAITNGTGNAATTVVEALNNIDATLGNIHGLYDGSTVHTTTAGASTVNGHSNLANGTTVEDHLVSLDNAVGDRTLVSKNNNINTSMKNTSLAAGLKAAGDAIGDMDFSSTHYVSGDTDLSSAVRSLDRNIYRIDQEVSDLKHDFRSGMASMAAMTALVPNARSQGDTSLSLGTGAYEGHTAMAIGGFHYINDNLLLNAGVSWGNSSDMAYRMGITYSW